MHEIRLERTGIYLPQKRALWKTNWQRHALILNDVCKALHFTGSYDEIHSKASESKLSQNIKYMRKMAFNSADINNVPDVHIAVKSEWEPVRQQEKQCLWHRITKKTLFQSPCHTTNFIYPPNGVNGRNSSEEKAKIRSLNRIIPVQRFYYSKPVC